MTLSISDLEALKPRYACRGSKDSTNVDSQRCEQDTKIFHSEISSQLHLPEIRNSNGGNDHESSQ